MKVLLYVQSTYGTGHLRMVLNLAKGLLKEHDVLMIYGGREVPYTIPEKIDFHELPSLVDDETRKKLKIRNSQYSMEYVMASRIQTIISLYDNFQPNVVIIEHFPFGRFNFRFEIEPLLRVAKNKRVFSSFRGIVGKELDMVQLRKDLKHFEKVFVHTDSNVTKLEDEIGEIDNLVYTGYLAPKLKEVKKQKKILIHPGTRQDTDKILNMQFESGHEIVSCKKFIDNSQLLREMAISEITVTPAGYNSAVEALTAKSKSILIPVGQEQEIRAKNFEDKGLATSINIDKLNPELLQSAIRKATFPNTNIDMNGAEFVCDYLK